MDTKLARKHLEGSAHANRIEAFAVLQKKPADLGRLSRARVPGYKAVQKLLVVGPGESDSPVLDAIGTTSLAIFLTIKSLNFLRSRKRCRRERIVGFSKGRGGS